MWRQELKDNPQLFVTKELCYFQNREDALVKEDYLQRKLKVVENCLYLNQAYAIPSGCFGKGFHGKDNPMFGKARDDARERMLRNNPMHDPEIAKQVSETKRLAREAGKHKSSRNSKQTLENTRQRMVSSNPNTIQCCCSFCRKTTTPSGITRFHKQCKEI